MGIVFMSNGVLSDFDTTSFIGQYAEKGRTIPYYSIRSATSGYYAKKDTPPKKRYNAAVYCQVETTTSNIRLIQLYNGTNVLGFLRIGVDNSYAFEVGIGSSTVVGQTALKNMYGSRHIEIDFFADPVNGWFKVYVNGNLEINYIGDTGTLEIDAIGFAPFFTNMSDLP